MTRNKGKQLNWGVERRYEFIEFRLFWQGRINRGDLMDAFGVSTQQASLDLNAYIDQAKRNLVYDKSLRTYLRGKQFKPKYLKPDAEEYFAQLRAVDQGLVSAEQSWISVFPGFGATPTPARGVAPETLRDVLAAIRSPAALQVTYQSMSRPEPNARWIEPHLLPLTASVGMPARFARMTRFSRISCSLASWRSGTKGLLRRTLAPMTLGTQTSCSRLGRIRTSLTTSAAR